MRKILILIATAVVATSLGGCSARVPDVISFKAPAVYPEGIDYDAKGKRFIVSSMHEGTVGQVTDDGTYKPFISDSRLVSSVGLRVDAARNRLLVCNSDPGASIHTKKENQGKFAGLAIYNLSTGELIKYIDLAALSKGGGHFCNDIAVDGDGNIYATDSFSPIIYKIDTKDNASILLEDKRFVGKGFNLNGLVYKDGYLVVAKDNDGSLFKVPVDKPKSFTEVKIDQKLVGADGLLWGPDGSLVVIANANTNKIFKLTSTDSWDSAKVANSVETGDVFATTGVLRDGKVYAMEARLNVLFNPKTTKHVDVFTIRAFKL
jgi:DNA-binding beta-propeller fold protein YncE